MTFKLTCFRKLSMLSLMAIAMLTTTTTRANAQQQYPLTCRGFGSSAATDAISVMSGPEIGHRFSIQFAPTTSQTQLSQLESGTCAWPDRGMRGDELNSPLFINLPATSTVWVQSQAGRIVNISAAAGRRTPLENSGGARRLNTLYEYSQASDFFTVCVSADTIGSGFPSTTPQRRPVFNVFKIQSGFSTDCG